MSIRFQACTTCGHAMRGRSALCKPCRRRIASAKRICRDCPNRVEKRWGRLCAGCRKIANDKRVEAIHQESPEYVDILFARIEREKRRNRWQAERIAS